MAKYVWRVEDRNGEGPYSWNHRISTRIARKHSRCDIRWPTPREEGIPIRGLICGFESKEAAKRWFQGCLGKLKKHGFKLKRIEASEVHYGKKQVTFKRKISIKGYVEPDYIPF